MAPDHIFGVASKHESGGVSTLLKGDYSPEQLEDDADLGKSVKEGWRNLGPAGRVSLAFPYWVLLPGNMWPAVPFSPAALWH